MSCIGCVLKYPLPKLTHRGRNKMTAIFQMTFSNAFSWMKIYELQLNFHWSLILSVQSTIFHHWFRQWLGRGQVASHCLNQWLLVYWCIYVSLSLNELKSGKCLRTVISRSWSYEVMNAWWQFCDVMLDHWTMVAMVLFCYETHSFGGYDQTGI